MTIAGRPRVAVLTREFPPEVYGGAGVHVEHLATALAELVDVRVHCFGAGRPSPLVERAYRPWPDIPTAADGGALGVLSVDLAMAAGVAGADLVHSHTWYANMGGHLARLLHGVPHVMTTHSLEPLRPWKAEQLGGGYALSSFAERTAIESADAVVAVSAAMAADIRRSYPAVDPARIEVIPNGIDAGGWHRVPGTAALERFGVDPDRPSVVFLGRMTRQKGIGHLLDAAELLDPTAQLVLCVGASDTPALGDELRARAADLAARRSGVVWIEAMLHRTDVLELLSHARVFVCPSIYEPFGLINLEAMACELPVVATATGGIVDVVVDGVTGWLVPFTPGGADGGPADPVAFARDLAEGVNRLLADPATARAMGRAGRTRVVESFTWTAVAARTAALYDRLLATTRAFE